MIVVSEQSATAPPVVRTTSAIERALSSRRRWKMFVA